MSSQKELIPMRPGDILRQEREQKGLSLERAARESRIRPAVLEAIEAGDTAHIPEVYLKGHIRHYARFLGLDPTDFEEHLSDIRGASPRVRSVFLSGPRQGNGEKWLKVSGYLAASVMIAALAWQFTHQAVRFSQGENGIERSVRAGTEPDQATAGQSEPQRGNGRTHLNASIAPVEVLQEQESAAANHAAEDAWAALRNPVPAADGHILSLETSADTWVEIFGANGEQLEMDLVRAGNSRMYRGEGPFQIMIGRASAVLLTLDGEAVDLAPHTRDNVASLVLAEVSETAVEPPENP